MKGQNYLAFCIPMFQSISIKDLQSGTIFQPCYVSLQADFFPPKRGKGIIFQLPGFSGGKLALFGTWRNGPKSLENLWNDEGWWGMYNTYTEAGLPGLCTNWWFQPRIKKYELVKLDHFAWRSRENIQKIFETTTWHIFQVEKFLHVLTVHWLLGSIPLNCRNLTHVRQKSCFWL